MIFKDDFAEKIFYPYVTSVYVTFIPDPNLLEYTKYPVSLVTGLATVGGLFAALRILLLLVQQYNRRHFEKTLKKSATDTTLGIKEAYSLEELKRLRERVEKLEEAAMRKEA